MVLFPSTSSQPNLKLRADQMATDIRTSELKKPVDVAEYLFRRLHEVGVRAVHGLPGDYNLGTTLIRVASIDIVAYKTCSCSRLHPEGRFDVGRQLQ